MVVPARQKLGDECPTVSSWFCAANGFVEREKRKKKLSKRFVLLKSQADTVRPLRVPLYWIWRIHVP